ncbi:MAG: DUF1619 domain-containing protein, partial [archaeon]|nr:DUF1619 domain-containing protein [archaeon]
MKLVLILIFFLIFNTNCQKSEPYDPDGKDVSDKVNINEDPEGFIPLDLKKNSKSAIEDYLQNKCFCKQTDGCDKYCCCDYNCNTTQIQIWIENDQCLIDEKIGINNKRRCVNKYLFSYNWRKNDIKGYTKQYSSDNEMEQCYSKELSIDLLETIEKKGGKSYEDYVANKLNDIIEELNEEGVKDNYELPYSTPSIYVEPKEKAQLITVNSGKFGKGTDDEQAFLLFVPDLNGFCYLGKAVVPFENIEPKECIMDDREKLREIRDELDSTMKIGNYKLLYNQDKSYTLNGNGDEFGPGPSVEEKRNDYYLLPIEIIFDETTFNFITVSESGINIEDENEDGYIPIEINFDIFMDENLLFCAKYRAIYRRVTGSIKVKFGVNFNTFKSGSGIGCENLSDLKDELNVLYSGNPVYDIGKPLRAFIGG